MNQTRAAAQRKLGFTTRLYYLGFGFLALLWIYWCSIDTVAYILGDGVVDSGSKLKYFQQIFLLLASICGSWYLLTGTRYSVFQKPGFIPQLLGLSVFFLVIYYAIYFDVFAIARFFQENEIKPIIFVVLCFWGIKFLGDFLSSFEKKIPRHTYTVITVGLFVFIPFGDLSDSHQAMVYVCKCVGIPFFILTIPAYYKSSIEYVKEHPEYRKTFVFGKGGAARWGGIYSFIRYDFTKFMTSFKFISAPIYCGKTLWFEDPKLGERHIGLDSDSMMLTVASMGGGKSYYAAWNTLLMWKGGAFVLDPKGEHAQRTSKRRGAFTKADVHIIDPWGDVSHLYEEQGATFNPLEEIDITSPNARDDLHQIVDSCIMQESSENANSKHFRENAQKIMLGIIAHVLSEYPEKKS